MTFLVYAKYGSTKESLQSGLFTAAFAKDWQEARSQTVSFLKKQGYKVVQIEAVQEVEVEKREWQK